MSNLHKQNFDLKLELFHRRERQAVLEQQTETLEKELINCQQSNGMLVQEMEKRDKAVEEAVHMIVTLEARIELLLREREITRQVETKTSMLSQLNESSAATLVNQATASKQQQGSAHNEDHTLDRMPSFLSEHTENTQNLRNVFMDPKTSYLSLSKTDSRVGNNGFVSPSMSILSESSFLSIYGQKNPNDSLSPSDVSPTIQSRLANSGQRSVSLPTGEYTPNTPQGADHRERFKNETQLGRERRLLRTPVKISPNKHTEPQTTIAGEDIGRSTTVRPDRSQVFPRVKNNSERPVRKVIIDNSGANHQRFPPTPDTMTSSIMKQKDMSEDAMRDERNSNDSRSLALTNQLTLDQTGEAEPGHWRFRSPEVAQAPSITAFTGRQETSAATAYHENRLPALRRPRSADETTISRHNNDWDSCSDADDLCSEASSFDYWMREGLRPSRGGTANAQPRTSGPRRDPPDLFSFPSEARTWQNGDMPGRLDGNTYIEVDSPLCSVVDALGASLPAPEAGIYGSGLADPNSSHPTGATAVPPPAPYRRSSLKAHTSTPGTPTTVRPPSSYGAPNEFEHDRKRSVSGQLPNTSRPNSNGWPIPDNRSKPLPAPPTRSQTQQQSDPKRHYPPHASQPQPTPRPRSRGITNLFRRSLGSATTPQPSASVPPCATQRPFSPPPQPAAAAAAAAAAGSTNKDGALPVMVGFPAWERTYDVVDREGCASPPPILRNRAVVDAVGSREPIHGNKAAGRSARSGSMSTDSKSGLGSGLTSMAVAAQCDGGVPLTKPPTDPDLDNTEAAQPSGQGHSRRWFNLSRASNHKSGGS
ncbi:unnamed protein product [Discula destructiva]